MNSRYQIGNAQTIGAKEIQSNYFSTVYNDSDDFMAVLADGTIDHPNGRRAAVMAAKFCVNDFLKYPDYTFKKDFLYEMAMKANKQIDETFYTGKYPRLSLSMVLFKGRELQFFNVGTNKIFLYNSHGEKTIENGKSYSAGQLELPQKSILGLFSLGAYADTHPKERINIITTRKNLCDKAAAVIQHVNEKKLKLQMNGTVLLVEVVK